MTISFLLDFSQERKLLSYHFLLWLFFFFFFLSIHFLKNSAFSKEVLLLWCVQISQTVDRDSCHLCLLRLTPPKIIFSTKHSISVSLSLSLFDSFFSLFLFLSLSLCYFSPSLCFWLFLSLSLPESVSPHLTLSPCISICFCSVSYGSIYINDLHLVFLFIISAKLWRSILTSLYTVRWYQITKL